MKRTVLTLLLTILALGYVGSLEGRGSSHESAQVAPVAHYQGRPVAAALRPDGKLNCLAESAAVTGYYPPDPPDPKGLRAELFAYPLKKQSTGGTFRLTFEGDQVHVVDEVTPWMPTMQFTVHARRDDGVVLVRGKGIGIEVMTIDPRNGSFVFSDTGVNSAWNRVNAWVGSCQEATGQ